MMIRVSGVVGADVYNWSNGKQNTEPHTQIRFYNPEEPKEKVKKDFDILLDKEMERLKIDVLV
jgi:hypothetical protein